MSGLFRFGVALVVVAAVLALAAMWWWALFGMTKDVGSAAIFTVFGVGFIGFTCLTFGSDL